MTESGSTGSGKTYISNALYISALRKFHTVKYIKASTLIYELEQAEVTDEYLSYMQKISVFDLLVIDDLGPWNLTLVNIESL